MKFCWSTLNVKNLDESIAFYTQIIGLEVNRRFDAGPGREIAFLGEGDTQIELICAGGGDIEVGKDISWGFETQSLDAAMALCGEKGVAISGPVAPNPHVRFCHFKDPNGMNIQLVENIG